MLIPIRLAPPASSPAAASTAVSTPAKGAAAAATATEPEEWSLLELNGTLSASLPGSSGGAGGNSNAAAGVGLGGLSLGQLSFPAPDKVSWWCVCTWVGVYGVCALGRPAWIETCWVAKRMCDSPRTRPVSDSTEEPDGQS